MLSGHFSSDSLFGEDQLEGALSDEVFGNSDSSSPSDLSPPMYSVPGRPLSSDTFDQMLPPLAIQPTATAATAATPTATSAPLFASASAAAAATSNTIPMYMSSHVQATQQDLVLGKSHTHFPTMPQHIALTMTQQQQQQQEQERHSSIFSNAVHPARLSAPASMSASASSSSSLMSPSDSSLVSIGSLTSISSIASGDTLLPAITLDSHAHPSDQVVPATTTGTKNKTKTTRKRNRNAPESLDQQTLVMRRQKHNQVEIRRRMRIAERFSMLQSLTNCEESKKGVILESAINLINRLVHSLHSMPVPAVVANVVSQVPDELPQAVAPLPSSAAAVSTTLPSNFQSSIASFSCTCEGDLLDCNEAFSTLAGYNLSSNTLDQQQVPKTNIFASSHSQTQELMLKIVSQLLSGELSSADCYRSFKRADGSYIKARWTMWLVEGPRKNKFLQGIVIPNTN